ncbi:putative oxalyl-CoA decarboxylase domain protein, partial [Mycobacterium xenopi 4042]
MRLLAQAQRPLIVLEKGAAYAQADNEIRQFVDPPGFRSCRCRWQGLLPDSHPQSVGLRVRWRWPARRDHAGRCPVNWLLATASRPMVGRRDVHPDRHRGVRIRQQSADRGTAAGDIGSVITALLDRVQELRSSHRRRGRMSWRASGRNDAAMRQRLADDPHPMQFHNALRPCATCWCSIRRLR